MLVNTCATLSSSSPEGQTTVFFYLAKYEFGQQESMPMERLGKSCWSSAPTMIGIVELLMKIRFPADQHMFVDHNLKKTRLEDIQSIYLGLL